MGQIFDIRHRLASRDLQNLVFHLQQTNLTLMRSRKGVPYRTYFIFLILTLHIANGVITLK